MCSTAPITTNPAISKTPTIVMTSAVIHGRTGGVPGGTE
jgi:hypothetical protein